MASFFDEPSATRSTCLLVEDRKVWVSREALSMYSPVFEVMFFGQFAEADRKVIPLPDKKHADILELLFCLLPTPNIKSIDSTNVDTMLCFADEYQIEFLKSACETFLRARLESVQGKNESLIDILRLADKHRLPTLVRECAKKCSVFSLEELVPAMQFLSAPVIAAVTVNMSGTTRTNVHNLNLTKPAEWCSHCRVNSSYPCHICGGYYCRGCHMTACSSKQTMTAIDNAMDAIMQKL